MIYWERSKEGGGKDDAICLESTLVNFNEQNPGTF